MRFGPIAAGMLCAPAILAAAPAKPPREPIYFTITLQNAPPIRTSAIKWGDAQSASLGSWAKADGLGVSWDAPDSPSAAGGAAGRVSGVASDPPDPNARGGHSMLGASDRITAGGARTETGQATGQRVHKPLRARMYYDQPQGGGPGSLVVKGGMPGCAAGKRYAGAQFASGNQRYELQDVVVTYCSADAAALGYKKVTVRGWNPEQKEE